MISRSRSPSVSAVANERADSGEEPGEEPWTRGALGRKDGYDRKSLPRRNWLYKIGSAPGSYTCLLRMQTSSPNACKPHAPPSLGEAPTRGGPFPLIHGRALDSRRDISRSACLRRCASTLPVVLKRPKVLEK